MKAYRYKLRPFGVLEKEYGARRASHHDMLILDRRDKPEFYITGEELMRLPNTFVGLAPEHVAPVIALPQWVVEVMYDYGEETPTP